MSRELVVLSQEEPDLDALPALVASSGIQGLDVGGPYIFDSHDRLLLRVQDATLITVPGEVERLLSAPAREPVWWVELHAAASPPEAFHLARHCARELATRHNGTVWGQ
ncbi:hypothetical protein [Actinomadura litoris]|uniref:Uncharacterized protein n=1 Tax=Actinomadura litoris TaxID=2678616 RepID=A0A7K1L8N1_9ACTN|nr:hypothetical protein [Actinomadura litoris]MUN40791.1 hypothetical protein [Actinomadura litoris]